MALQLFRKKRSSGYAEAMPRDPDAVPQRICWKCGMTGKHDDVMKDCVPALRDRIATLEFNPGMAVTSPNILASAVLRSVCR
jgi:hypothetical protein